MTTTHSLIQINTDGGSRGNPGPSAIGVSASSEGETIFEISKYIGETTNNVAEYSAVIEALSFLRDHNLSAKQVTFILDSELIVRQIMGVYKVKQSHLLELKNQVLKIISDLKSSGQVESFDFNNVLREKNKVADRLVNEALDKR